MSYDVTIRGIASLNDLKFLPREVAVIASRAVNQTARKYRTASSRMLREQINFPARYLSGADGKITLAPSSPASLEAKLSASSNPRSLARFAVGSAAGKGKVKVEVTPGSTRTLPGAFLLKISGSGGGENSLLAVRSPTKPRSAYKPRRLGKSLWLLYGPSVSQALLHDDGNKGIWPEIEPDIASSLEREFLRQLKVEGI